MSTPAEKANLARIRDNQRRSRARRKEYLQELERRLRLVELQGIEASAEIQGAARKVADENKKLRTLLNKHGINDDSIDAFLGSGIIAPPGDAAIASQYRPAVAGNSVNTLEQLLGPRRPTCIEPGAPLFPIPAGMAPTRMGDPNGRDSRETSVTSISTVWDNASSQHSRSLSGSVPVPQQTTRLTSQQQYLAPASSAGALGRNDGGLGLQGLGSIMEDHRTSRSHTNPSPSSAHPDRHHQAFSSYDMQHLLHNPSAYNPQPRRPDLSGHPYPPSPMSNYIPSTTSGSVDVMSSMSALDCQVADAAFNHALDRYTATTLGM